MVEEEHNEEERRIAGLAENVRRVAELRAFAKDARIVPILVQEDPDPDGMASALGLRLLLDRPEADAPIISLGEVTRPENQRMAELLRLRVTRVTASELASFGRVVTVDTQPPPGLDRVCWAVVDHHPERGGYETEFVDIRPGYGAAATMVTEYLRAAGDRDIPALMATALLYGIRTDTEVLRRGTGPADVVAYAFLQGIADQELLRRIGRPAFSEQGMRAVGRALAGLAKEGDVAVAFVGRLDDRSAHVLPNLADFVLALEGVSWSAAAGLVGDEMAINIRRVGGGSGAGDLALALAEEEGRGGGHRSMARVGITLREGLPHSEEAGDQRTVQWLADRVVSAVESLRALR